MTTQRLHLNRRALIEAQVRAGVSVADLSSTTGVHQATIYRIMAGNVPRIPTAKKLADALGISVGDILQFEDAA